MEALREDIRFYCGLGEKHYNHHSAFTGPFACISPVNGRGGTDKQGRARKQKRNSIAVPEECEQVILDSGAYSDTTYRRCTFEESLQRQLAHAKEFDYLDKLSHIASYDVLIDEQDRDGVRVKERWDVNLAEFAVRQTINAAEYLVGQRNHIRQQVGHDTGLILSAQGVDVAQYVACTQRVLPLMEEGDIFGLGGWCILGKRPVLLPTFYEAMNAVVPMLAATGVRRTHIWGVCYAPALGALLWLCDKYGIQLSTDSIGPSTRMVIAHRPGYAVWGYSSWVDNNYPIPPVMESCKEVDAQGNKAPSCEPGTRCRGLERARHVAATREWLSDFRRREAMLYRHVPASNHTQLNLWDEAI